MPDKVDMNDIESLTRHKKDMTKKVKYVKKLF